MEDSRRSKKQSKKKSKLNFGNERPLIAHHSPRSPISEQYRTLRTNIEFSSIDLLYQNG